MKPIVSWSHGRAQVKAPPSSGKLTPSWAALMPVASATLPPSSIATRIPLPATWVAAPNAAKMPVPTIIAAVKSVVVSIPSSRLRPLRSRSRLIGARRARDPRSPTLRRARARRARKARDEVADEHGGDDNRSRRDHAHGHGVEEFALGEPAVVAHDPLLEERHDREPGPEGERTGLEEEDPELHEHVRIGGLCDERAESHRNRRRRDRESPKPARWRIEQHAEEPGEHEEHRHLAANRK